MQRNSKLPVMFLMMLSMLTFVMLPTSTMPWEQPNVYEPYGPRLDNIHFVFTGSPEESFLALDVGDVDIIDWPLSKSWKDTWEDPARTDIKVMGYGGEYSFYILDCRQNNIKPVRPPFSTQSYVMTGDLTVITMDLSDYGEGIFETTRGAQARHALAHMIDRTWIASTVMGGLGEPIYTPAPAAQGEYVNPYVEKHPQDFDRAREILTQAGFTDNDDDGWRDIPGTTTAIVLDFFIRLGIPTELAGQRIAADVEAELNIHVNEQFGDLSDAQLHIMENQEMDLYTGHWTGINWPDHLAWNYGSQGYSPPTPGYAPTNYMRYCGYRDIDGDGQIDFDPEVEDLMTLLLECLDEDEAQQAAWDVQEALMKKENVYTIPLVSTAAPKAWRTYKVGTAEEPGNEWKGMVNETGFGVNSWWTFISAHTDNEPYSGTMTYGLSHAGVDFLNPIYASQPQSWEILGKIYDSLLVPDPLTNDIILGVAQDFKHVKEYDTAQGEEVSVLYCTLRRDVYWHDGERLTAFDVNFTLAYLPERLATMGLPPPSWNRNVNGINRVEIIDDFHIRVYMEYKSYFAPIWAGLNIIMPEHVWRPIIDGIPTVSARDVRLTMANSYPAGSVVLSGDTDVGMSLVVFAGDEMHAENMDVNGAYDVWEWIYRDVDGSGHVTAGDVRLTYVPGYNAGTTVEPGDTDVGASLFAFAPDEMHAENEAANQAYDVDEYIYRDAQHPTAFNPDPFLLGSGPYKCYPLTTDDIYSEGVSIDLYASKGLSPIPPWWRALSPIQNFISNGEITATAVSLPPPPPPLLLPSEIYWVGQSYAGDVCVTAPLANLALTMTIVVTVTLFEGPVPIGTQVITMPPGSWVGLRFPRPIAGGIGATIGPLAYQLDGTYPFPFPFIDADALTLYYKVTCDGDVISTADIPGVFDVNVYDAMTLMDNWGSTGPYTYAPADINWDGTVNIFDALIIMGNYGDPGA